MSSAVVAARRPSAMRRGEYLSIRDDVVVATEHIDAPPEVVFPYFTEPDLLVQWIGDRALLDPQPGAGMTRKIQAPLWTKVHEN